MEFNIEFDDVERAYQYSKAVKFNDCNTSERIICSRSPSAAKRLGASVKNFNTQDWDNVKEEIMLEILRIKFAPNTDLAAKLTVGYEPGDLTVHPPPPPELPRVGSFFSYRCLVFPKKCPQRKACAFRIY